MLARGERLPHRPALGSEQAEEGCRRLPGYWFLLPPRKDHLGGFFLIWGQTAERFLCCPKEPCGTCPASSSPPGCAFVRGPGGTDSRTPTRENRRAEGLRATLPDKGICYHLAAPSASNCSCWPYCGFCLFNWSLVSTQLFPLTELGSTPGQNVSTPLWPASTEDFPVPEYRAAESFIQACSKITHL